MSSFIKKNPLKFQVPKQTDALDCKSGMFPVADTEVVAQKDFYVLSPLPADFWIRPQSILIVLLLCQLSDKGQTYRQSASTAAE